LVKQDRGKLPPGHTFLFAVKRSNKKGEIGTLSNGKPLAAQRRSRRAASQTPVQTLQAVQTGVEILVDWNEESVALPTRSTNEPEPMASGGIVEQDVPAIARFDAHQHGRKAIEVD
jgi:hypothetical protein